ncbi:Uncharacterized protein Fot_36424 [Forsythia ovata]|uniref:Uncharacterized protein n=1 Tax=Forsythia ovata TaxID=205694 RepID=A0ABD1SQ04_9LAMI
MGLAGLVAKKILPVMKVKTTDHEQKKTLSGLSLKEGLQELVYVKKVLEGRLAEIAPVILIMSLDHLTKAATNVDSFWMESWTEYPLQSSPEQKLVAAKTLAARSMMSIEKAEIRV